MASRYGCRAAAASVTWRVLVVRRQGEGYRMSEAVVILASVTEQQHGQELHDKATAAAAAVTPPPGGMRTFVHVLVNTMIAN
ncbi:MAG: hypothetical protein M3Y46_10355, partial [Actinomycetota bacterium]|nr:hypothetical protein [Actinomycetota bacterium]